LNGGKLVKVQRSVVVGPVAQMTKSQAKQALEVLLRPLNEGVFSPTQRMTFGDFCDRWEKEILTHYRPSTQKFYRATLKRWIRPYFDKWQLEDIRPVEVQAFVNRFGEYSASVLKHLRATLSCVFDTAVKWQYVKTNPVAGLDLPEGKRVQRAKVLTPDQIQTVIRHLAEPYRTMVVVLAGTATLVFTRRRRDSGMRASCLEVGRHRLYRPGNQGAPVPIPGHR
jgi:hypothetical protein